MLKPRSNPKDMSTCYNGEVIGFRARVFFFLDQN